MQAALGRGRFRALVDQSGSTLVATAQAADAVSRAARSVEGAARAHRELVETLDLLLTTLVITAGLVSAAMLLRDAVGRLRAADLLP